MEYLLHILVKLLWKGILLRSLPNWLTLVQNQKNIKFTIRMKLKSEVKVSDWLVERGATFPGSITEHGEADPMQSRRPIGKCLSLWEKAPQENKGKMKNEFSWINHRARGSWSNAILTSNWKMLKSVREGTAGKQGKDKKWIFLGLPWKPFSRTSLGSFETIKNWGSPLNKCMIRWFALFRSTDNKYSIKILRYCTWHFPSFSLHLDIL